MNSQATQKTELNKILALASQYAVLEGGKTLLEQTQPTSSLAQAKERLQITEECLELLFHHGVPKVEYFTPLEDEPLRAQKGSALSCGELLKVGAAMRSIRIAYTSINGVNDENIVLVKRLADGLYFDKNLEEDIFEKIRSDTEVSDYASDRLFSLRREIRLLNERIRARLAEYLTGDEGKYLQESIVTMRANRYVLPVRAEYKRNVKGFIHDRSASGATFFIEPEEVLEMNNELRSLTIDEREEVERILAELSSRVGALANELNKGIAILEEIDAAYARAQYAYKQRAVCPTLNDSGLIDIQMGRHPLIDKNKVVPVSLSLGKDYRFLLISGPNTGGKTVTLKMVGLFCMMAMCGLFIPAKRASLSVFDEIYCDVGDAQSIEESLSTFSSHITNIIQIVEKVTKKCLVLIDELGGGTDPEEGQALAKAIVSHLLTSGAVGVITTHYTAMKEFAFEAKGIENACMEFDADTLEPLYVIKIGMPGSSNALAISRRLGLREDILQAALSNLSEGAQTFENIVRSAEQSRIAAEEALKETNVLKAEWEEKLNLLSKEREKVEKEKEKLYASAKAESRRIIHDRVASAEELLEEIEALFRKETLSEADLIHARTLKNKMANTAFASDNEEEFAPQYRAAEPKDIVVGATVYVQSIASEGVVQSVRAEKKEAEVLCGNLRIRSKYSNLSVVITGKTAQATKKPATKAWANVQVKKSLQPKTSPASELNIIGRTVYEAIPEVEAFIDGALLVNLEEVRIIHGVGTGKLRSGVQEYLRTNKNVAEFRFGKYTEGDMGVTIVKLK